MPMDIIGWTQTIAIMIREYYTVPTMMETTVVIQQVD